MQEGMRRLVRMLGEKFKRNGELHILKHSPLQCFLFFTFLGSNRNT